MFQLTSDSVVQFTALVVYVILTTVILFYGQSRLRNPLLLFIIASATWGAASLFAGLWADHLIPKALAPMLSAWVVVAYANFAAAFVQRVERPVALVGYAWLAVVILSIGFGLATQVIPALDNIAIYRYYGWSLQVIALGRWAMLSIALFLLIKSLRSATDPEERNRTAYLLAGLCLIVAVDIAASIIPGMTSIAYHLSNMANGILVTYALARYRLLNLRLIMRKWLVYTGVSVCITLAYFALLLGLSRLLPLLPPQVGIPATVVMVVLFACLFNWLKSALDKGADRLFYGKGYAHRKLLLAFAGKVNSLISMEEIASALLRPLANAIGAAHIALMLPGSGGYAARFTAAPAQQEPMAPVTLQGGSPLTAYLEKEGKPVLAEAVMHRPEFGGLTAKDRDAISSAQIQVLCPVLSRHRLVGILALGKKHPRGSYSRDDVDLAMMLVSDAAAAIENAQIYADAKEKADTDELTGLRNHRYFQQRLNEEIERSSRLGKVFSLLFMDLDFFKTYNDLYGHVLGDETLRDVGRLIKRCVRDTDAAARYGGDEFAIILPQTSLDSAQAIAEGIRRQLELVMAQRDVAPTCSIGVACWSKDGMMRGQVIDAADRALDHAKRIGGNRVCLASPEKASESGRDGAILAMDSNPEIESIVYALAATVDARDHYTYDHSKNVGRYAAEIARAIGYSHSDIERIRAAALLHDIGKLNLPDRLFTKSEALTDEEWEMIRRHPGLGVGILKHIVGLRGCLEAIMFHHERYDGAGYPKGLRGNDIPLDARIMAVADAYDAITSARCYKESTLCEAEAIEELERCAGTQFDPAIVKVFADAVRESPEMAVQAGRL